MTQTPEMFWFEVTVFARVARLDVPDSAKSPLLRTWGPEELQAPSKPDAEELGRSEWRKVHGDAADTDLPVKVEAARDTCPECFGAKHRESRGTADVVTNGEGPEPGTVCCPRCNMTGRVSS
jgi:hypothetical protein